MVSEGAFVGVEEERNERTERILNERKEHAMYYYFSLLCHNTELFNAQSLYFPYALVNLCPPLRYLSAVSALKSKQNQPQQRSTTKD
jgi:hypothetical protein